MWLGACVCAAFFATACASLGPHFEVPQVSVVGIEMRGGNLFQQNFLLTLRIQNPNRLALPVDRVHARLQLGGAEFATGAAIGSFVVPPLGSARVDITITANLAAGIAQLAQALDRPGGTVAYQLDGAVRLGMPLFRTLPFHQSGTLPLGTTCPPRCSEALRIE
ncbi:MAG TPA: LEA type 2 family protein [Steroidobacteraceae bacterium]|nr:LEA type 2 family protein [Steroidobacteraceae bacterium]